MYVDIGFCTWVSPHGFFTGLTMDDYAPLVRAGRDAVLNTLRYDGGMPYLSLLHTLCRPSPTIPYTHSHAFPPTPTHSHPLPPPRIAGVGDIESRISSELVITPKMWEERYGLMHGAAFGLSHGLGQLAALRPANEDTKVKGLYFVGASTRPGNGVPLAMISAKLTAEKILFG